MDEDDLLGYWEWNWADSYERQMKEFGYAELRNDEDHPSWRMTVLAETRWDNHPGRVTGSVLWDTPKRERKRGRAA